MAAPTPLPGDADLAAMADALAAHPDYRVLRRLAFGDDLAPEPPGADVREALVVDVETTGTDRANDAIIELGLVRFAYDATSGQPLRVLASASMLEDPGRPIPPEVVALTGIDDAMVAGRRIDETAVETIIGDARLVIAHNAAFDRPFVERRLPRFADLHWACSQRDVDWRALGVGSAALEFLVYRHCGGFFDGHRAADDCRATLQVLATATPDGTLPMRVLLENARQPRVRVCAVNSPFESKDVLRARGYQWSGNEGSPAKTWCRELPKEAADDEVAWLQEAVYAAFGRPSGSPVVQPVDLRRRYA
jgi:DNA polymerase-3 subunit epsilon